MQSKKEMPLEHKPILTIREASFYTGISEKKQIYMPAHLYCGWVIADLSREKHSRNLFRHRNLREVQMMNRLNDEWFSSKSESVPLWHKIALSIDEMYIRALVEKQYENLQSNRKQNNLH